MRRRDEMPVVRLPNEVVEMLNTKGIPGTAVEIRKAEGVDMPLTTRGCQELAARMRAEREVFEEAKKLDAVRGEAVALEDLKATIAGLEEQLAEVTKTSTAAVRDARDQAAQAKGELTRQIAKNAMAEAAEGTGR